MLARMINELKPTVCPREHFVELSLGLVQQHIDVICKKNIKE